LPWQLEAQPSHECQVDLILAAIPVGEQGLQGLLAWSSLPLGLSLEHILDIPKWPDAIATAV